MPEGLPRTLADLPELSEARRSIFEEKVVFNKTLGLRVVSMDSQAPKLRFAMKPEMVGNFMRGILHGGVMSAVLDVASGPAAYKVG